MHIKIALKFRPFSHEEGTRCLIPFSSWEAQIFPAKVFFLDLSPAGTHVEMNLPIEGPVDGFTILQDLEKGRIEVFGKAKRGFFRYYLTPDALSFARGETFPLDFIEKHDLVISKKRLSFGVHKKQDWDLIQRRCETEEFFPFWVRISQFIPKIPLPYRGIGTDFLLMQGKLKETFQAAFLGILSPRLKDERYLGLIPDQEISPEFSSLGIIHEGARQIEELLFFEDDENWNFLPHLPKELHAGRFVSFETKKGDFIDFEWSKKELKKVVIHPAQSRQIKPILQRSLKTYRVRKSLRHKGETKARDEGLNLEKGQIIYLDKFLH